MAATACLWFVTVAFGPCCVIVHSDGQGRGEHGAAMHAFVQLAADPDMPPSWRAWHGWHGCADTGQE